MDCEWINGRGDVVFAPIIQSADLPPIVVEIQNTVDTEFIRRIMNYCWNAQSKFDMKPRDLSTIRIYKPIRFSYGLDRIWIVSQRIRIGFGS